MRLSDLTFALRPFIGQVLVAIRDDDRQEHMDRLLQEVRGWQLESIQHRRCAVPTHPEGCCDVSLVFVHDHVEGSGEFALQMLARTIHSVTVRPGDGHQLQMDILFKRGSTSTLVFGPAPEGK